AAGGVAEAELVDPDVVAGHGGRRSESDGSGDGDGSDELDGHFWSLLSAAVPRTACCRWTGGVAGRTGTGPEPAIQISFTKIFVPDAAWRQVTPPCAAGAPPRAP